MSVGSLRALIEAIAAGDDWAATGLLAASPGLATARMSEGATRGSSTPFFAHQIGCYLYAGVTALHVAAAAYSQTVGDRLLVLGAEVGARNRRGAQPLHYAASGSPGSPFWDPDDQVAVIGSLVRAGADLDAVDLGGITPLHRAVRCRCAAAVGALLQAGADAGHRSNRGSTPVQLATRSTGRAGAGSPEARSSSGQSSNCSASGACCRSSS